MIRLIIGATVLTGFVWFTFSVKLGRKTFAEHIEAINKTREAKELMKGMGSVVRPALDEAKERVLGEYIEAPTTVHRTRPSSSTNSKQRDQVISTKTGDKTKSGSRSNQIRRPAQAKSETATCSAESGKSKHRKKSEVSSRKTARNKHQTSKSPSNKPAGKAVDRKQKGREKTKKGSPRVNTKVSQAHSHSPKSPRSSDPANRRNSEPG